jgi:DNA primase catalytic subunit
MLAFYRRLYPFKSIFKWLNHEHVPSRLFTHREIAFTLQNDVYLRYNSFTTADEFKRQTNPLVPLRAPERALHPGLAHANPALFLRRQEKRRLE